MTAALLLAAYLGGFVAALAWGLRLARRYPGMGWFVVERARVYVAIVIFAAAWPLTIPALFLMHSEDSDGSR